MEEGEAAAPLALGVLPDEPLPVRLMNTVWADRHGVHDSLELPAALDDWLHLVGIEAAPATQEDLDAFRALRQALRRLAALLTADTRVAVARSTVCRDLDLDPEDAVECLNRCASRAPTRVRLVSGTLRREDDLGDPLSAVAGQAMDLLSGQASVLLRACRAPGCVLYFVKDHPRRAWCSTSCGNRERAARYYQRRRPVADGRATAGAPGATQRDISGTPEEGSGAG